MTNLLTRFATWRFDQATSDFHMHLEDCMVCECDGWCPKVEHIKAREKRWSRQAHKNDLLFQIVIDHLTREEVS